MSAIAEKSDPQLWERVKRKITRGSKGGKPGQWSARKAQMAVQEYKKQGGGYRGRKGPDNHLQQWEDEEWGTKSGRKSGETDERYLPKAARERLSAAEYRRTSAKKRADSGKGKQHSRQPKDVAAKAARARKAKPVTKAGLMAKARKLNIPGRSKMTKAQLARAVG